MTDTGPRPPDIPFDHGAAAVAIGALEQAGAVLGDVATSRHDAAVTAAEHFRGVYAEDFGRVDGELGAAGDDARTAAVELRRAIEAGVEAARAAQAVRTLEQEAWDAAHPKRLPAGAW
jgi:hypothetical protein